MKESNVIPNINLDNNGDFNNINKTYQNRETNTDISKPPNSSTLDTGTDAEGSGLPYHDYKT